MTETYPLASFTSGLAVGQFQDEILASSIATNFVSLLVTGSSVDVIFSIALTGPEKLILDGLVAAHVPGTPPPDLSDVRNNLNATTDPTITDDIDEDYDVGSLWINVTDLRIWGCIDSSSGAAIWKRKSNMVLWNSMFSYEAVSSSYITIGKITWDQSINDNFTEGILSFRSTISDRDLDIRLGTNTFNVTSSGTNKLLLTLPSVDTDLELEVKKSASGGTNPGLSGVAIYLS